MPRKPEPPRDVEPRVGMAEAGAEFIDKAEVYRRYIQEGIDAADAGDVYDWEDVEAEVDALLAAPLP